MFLENFFREFRYHSVAVATEWYLNCRIYFLLTIAEKLETEIEAKIKTNFLGGFLRGGWKFLRA